MAEASDDADVGLVCSLCLEQFVHPRKLPDCGHCFCETCLITYMTKLNDNKELENKSKCPVCTKYNIKPEGIAIKEWVMLFETDCVKGQRHGRRDQDKCASCKSLGRESKPTVFCLDCIKSLCHGCSEIRHTYEPIQHHKCIDIEKTFKNGDEAETISMLSEYLDLSCDSHPNEAVNYCCKDNKVFCCAACRLTDHRKCNSVFTINELVEAEGVKKKKKQMTELISQLLKYVETVVSKIESCATDYKKQIEEIARKIKEIRAKINQIMDSLEEALNDQAKAKAKQHVLMTTEVIDGLKEMTGNLRVYEGLTETIETCGSQIHQYIVTSKIIGKIRDQESAILDTTRAFRFTELSLKPQSPLLEILQIGLNDSHKLAYVEEQTNYNYSLPAYEVASSLEYDKITQTCHKVVQENYTGREPTYSSLVFLPNDDFVLIDTDNDEGHGILAKGDGTVVASRDFKYCSDKSTGSREPYCATVIKNGEIAVSIPDKKKICIISADKQLKSTFTGSTKYKPKAIHGLRTGDIAVAFDDPVAFGIISFDDIPEPTENIHVYFSHDKEGRELKNFDYMAVDENRSHVIQPSTTDKAVYCFDFNGNPKFKYKKDDFCPRGVAVDGYGSIFVCDNIYQNHAIHVISPTGNAVRVIQKSEGCPIEPLAIGFKKNGEVFAVTQDYSPYRQVTFFGFQKPS